LSGFSAEKTMTPPFDSARKPSSWLAPSPQIFQIKNAQEGAFEKFVEMGGIEPPCKRQVRCVYVV